MKTPLNWTVALLCFAATSVSAAPTIASQGVRNAASYANPGFQNGSIAQGSLFVVFGSGMGPSEIQYSSSFPLPTTLAGTSVSATVNGTTVPCIMIYTQDRQVAAILPSTTPVGTGTLSVTYNGATSSTEPLKVVANSLGLFTRNQQGSGPAVLQDAFGGYNSFTSVFRPGQTVTFWGTGLGPIAGSDAAVPPSGNLPGTNVTALIGGQSATVTYAGRSAYAGVDQINVTIPSGVTGCFVSVGLFVNAVPSNFTSISVASGGTLCSDPNLFSAADLQSIVDGKPLRFGATLLSQYTATGTISGLPLRVDYETGRSFFQRYDATSFVNSLSGLGDIAVSPGSCAVFQYVKGDVVDVTPTARLDAGDAINVSGGGTSMMMTKSAVGVYQGTFSNANPLSPSAPFLKPGGVFAVDNGAGGTNVGAFNVNSTLPPAITWDRKPAASTIPRNQDLTINWTGGDPAGFVYVYGQSPLDANDNGAEFMCVARNSDRALTVPKEILSALPVSATVSLLGFTIPGGVLVVNSTSITRSTASGLDVFLNAATTGDAKGAFTFQ